MLPFVSLGPICSTCVLSQIHLHFACAKPDVFPIGPGVWPHFPVFWIVDPIKPPKMSPRGIVGRIVFSLCPFQDESTDVYQIWCQSVQPFDSFPWLLNVWPRKPPPPKCPIVSLGAICLAYIHSQMNLHICTKFGANRIRRLTSSPDFWICDPLTPPPPPNVEGRILSSLYPFPDESADVYQIWCQSVQPFDSLPDFWICDPLNPPKYALCLEVQFVWHISIPDESALVCQILYQSVQPFGSFSWICATLVRLLATGRAVSRKNTPKNNIYTSKIIIPARTCGHQRH